MNCLAALCLLIVTSVTDGDTFRSGDTRIRIWGIDAPELRNPGGPASKAALAALIDGQVLACEMVDTDRYGRTVARCELPVDIACEMVRAGQARDWRKYSKGRYAGCAVKIGP